MELFYYCLSAQKEEAPRAYNHSYLPQENIDYDEKPEKTLESDSEEEIEEEEAPASLYEVDGEEKAVEEEEAPPEPEPEAPEIIEPEHGVNLLRRNNSRKFKTPSFKWKKKKKNREPYLSPPSPSAPELSVTEDLADLTVDDNVEAEEEEADKVSVDSLNDKVAEKEEEVVVAAASNNAEAERLAQEAEFFKERLREAEELLNRYKTDNMMLHQRVEMAERDRGASEHGNFVELEKVREEYQEKLNELSQYPEKLSSAEARYQHAEAQSEALNSQLADKNQTVEELQKKIDLFQGQIGKLKTKIHAVNEDNIELSNKSQSHERKVLEADLHNKNLMDLVSKKDDAVEAHQPSVDEQLANLPPPPASPSTDNNMSEPEKGMEESGSETGSDSESESEEEIDWSEMLKSAEQNRERLGLDEVSDGESTEDEEGNRVPKKKEQNGITTEDIMNRMATNQLMGYDEFGRPLNGKYNGGMSGMSGKRGMKNRAMLFGMDGGKRNTKSGSNNKGAGRKDRSGRSGGRRAKKGGNSMALLGF